MGRNSSCCEPDPCSQKKCKPEPCGIPLSSVYWDCCNVKEFGIVKGMDMCDVFSNILRAISNFQSETSVVKIKSFRGGSNLVMPKETESIMMVFYCSAKVPDEAYYFKNGKVVLSSEYDFDNEKAEVSVVYKANLSTGF